MYEGEFADIYDRIHTHRGKDYAAETDDVTALIRARRPDAASVLDVCSGTGGHLRHLHTRFDSAEGLEFSPEMIAHAKAALPGVTVHQGDMRDFDLDHQVDAVTLMFSSIGYVDDFPDLVRTITCLSRHLTPGGVVVIEPWVFPDTFADNHLATDLVRDPAGAVTRFSRSVRKDDAVIMTVHYLVADDHGIRHLSDEHRLALFTREQYLDAFAKAGCPAEFIQTDRFRRGLFIGVKTKDTP